MPDLTFTEDGVTYNITDHSSDGLTAEQMKKVIQNLHKTDSYKQEISNDLRDAGGQNKVVDVHIDKPGINGTSTFDPGNGEQTAINMNSDDFIDGSKNTFSGENGESVQQTVDTTFVHEVAHLHQERVGEDDDGDGDLDPHDGTDGEPTMGGEKTAEEEEYARRKANEVREEIGETKRKEAHEKATEDLDGDGDIDEDDDAMAESLSEAQRQLEGINWMGQHAVVDMDGYTGGINFVPDDRYAPNYNATNAQNPVLNYGVSLWDYARSLIHDLGQLVGAAAQIIGDAVQAAFDVAAQALQDLGEWAADVMDAWGLPYVTGSPLTLDLDGDGIELISLENSNIYWDIDGDGFAELSGWVAADDGLLAIDLDGDGVISMHTELFGSITEDGFTALSVYDTNSDGVIDANDAQFADLLVWQDVNQNGVSEATELYTLADLDIVSIDLNATTPYNMYIEGHNISHVSSYTVDDGVNGPQTFDIVDVWFEYDNVNTNYVGDYTLDLASLFVTTIRGYGVLPDLHVAASIDNDTTDPDSLMSLLQDFSSTDFSQFFVDDRSVMETVRDIMFRWAGVDDLDPTSRGSHVDARELEFLEALSGEGFIQNYGHTPNPGSLASEAVHRAFETALYPITAKLIAQAAGSSLFNDGVFYNPLTDTFDGFTEFNQDTLDALLAISADGTVITDKTTFWVNIVNIVNHSIGIDNLSTTDTAALEAILQASDGTLTIAAILEKITKNIDDNLSWTPAGDSLSGTTGDDVYDGSVGDDYYNAGYGNDTLNGGIGDDILYGGNGNDILNGQLGDDYLKGDGGDDIYLFSLGHGNDTITDSGGTDKIIFGEGISLADLTIVRTGSYDLSIIIDPNVGAGSITILNQVSENGGVINTLEFYDSSVFDLNAMDHTYIGDATDQTIWGVSVGYGGTGVDTIYGMDGNDVIYGYKGGAYSYTAENYLYGGNGDDSIYGDRGADQLYGGAGDDFISGNDGADTYYFNYGDGNDTYSETTGDYAVDRIVFGAGITLAMIDIERQVNGDLMLTIDGGLGGTINIVDQINVNAQRVIEEFEFADATIITSFDEYVLDGTEANETLKGVGIGGSGIDIIYGNGGNDYIYGYLSNAVYGSQINYLYGGDGNDHIYGEDGNDVLEGGNGNDVIYGYAGDDLIKGGDGDDSLYGAHGNDVYHMGLGNDYVEDVNGGDDTFVYTGGMDVIYQREGGDDTLVLDIDTTINDIDIVQSGNHYNLIIDAGVNEVQLQWFFYNSYYPTETIEFQDGFTTSLIDFPSWISGTSVADTLNGTSSGDTLIGKGGDDVISGLAGDDDIHGGAGNDALYGGDGLDNLWGGDGADSFVFESASAFNNVDIIGDFDLAENDAIDIADLLSGYDPLTDAISDFVQITDNGTDSVLSVDADGGADNFVQIATLTGVTGLTDENALEISGNLIAA